MSYAGIIWTNCLDKVSNVEQLDVLNGPVMTAEHLGHMDGPHWDVTVGKGPNTLISSWREGDSRWMKRSTKQGIAGWTWFLSSCFTQWRAEEEENGQHGALNNQRSVNVVFKLQINCMSLHTVGYGLQRITASKLQNCNENRQQWWKSGAENCLPDVYFIIVVYWENTFWTTGKFLAATLRMATRQYRKTSLIHVRFNEWNYLVRKKTGKRGALCSVC